MPETGFLNPERVISYLDVPRGSVAADFGAGTGFYTMALARRVGPEGKVYAYDVLKHAVDRIRSEAQMLHLLQVEAVVADLERPRGSRLKDAVADFVLAASIIHQAENKSAVLQEAHRILKPGRYLALVEWSDAPSRLGPPRDMRISKARARELAESAGFMLDREFEAGSFHYGLLFKKR